MYAMRVNPLSFILVLATACGRGGFDAGGDTTPAGSDDGTVAGGDGVSAQYAYTQWTDWAGCGGPSYEQSRTRACTQRDGAEVDCSFCGGECLERQLCECVNFNVADCSTSDPTACSALLADYYDVCAATGCQVSGTPVCSIGGSPSSTTCIGGFVTCAP